MTTTLTKKPKPQVTQAVRDALRPKGTLTSSEAAEYTGFGESTLRAYRRQESGGPVWRKIGSRVVYDVADLDRWIEALKAASAIKDGVERHQTPDEAVQIWLDGPRRSAEINEHFKVDAYSTELSTEPIRLRRIELGVLIPRYITAEEEEEEEEEYYQTHRGPFWSVTADDGSVCIESRKLSDLVLWLPKFSEKFDEAVVELEAAK